MKFLLLSAVLADKTADPEFEDVNFWETDENEMPKLELMATSRFLGSNRLVEKATESM